MTGAPEPDDTLARSELGATTHRAFVAGSRPGPLVAVVGTLVVSNVMANRVLPAWAYVPWNCGIAALLVVVAVRLDGCSADELGLARRRLPDGLRWGGAVVAGLVGVYLAGVALPFTRELFEDDRADIALRSLLWQVLVMVPLGTVLLEEVAFRGVLPAMLRRRIADPRTGPLRADLVAAGLFGLWHILPAWNVNSVNPVFRDLLPGPLGQLAAITAGVVGTAAAGMGLSWLRNRSGSLAAPLLLHTATNSLGYVVAWLVQQD